MQIKARNREELDGEEGEVCKANRFERRAASICSILNRSLMPGGVYLFILYLFIALLPNDLL